MERYKAGICTLKGVIIIKNKQLLYLIIFLIFIFLAFKGCSALKANSLHAHISSNDIQSIVIRGRNKRTATPEETGKIVTWFNSINHINSNPDFAGTTDSSSIEIVLKSNEKIGILFPGMRNQDLEIQRNNRKGKLISYWGNQSDIRKILEEAAAE